MINDKNRLIIAMDFAKKHQALSLVDNLDPKACRLKVGKEMFSRFGPEFVGELQGRGFDIFLDLKFHDIPNTVANACVAVADLGVWMINIHTSGGRKMMQAAASALQKFGIGAPLLTGVTVLTSMSEEEMLETGVTISIEQRVLMLAKLAKDCGLDGIVCSALEVEALRREIMGNFLLVTPGIRPIGSEAGDQKRIMTVEEALLAGADYLVIGRPITQASKPLKALCEITDSIDSCLATQQ